MFKKNYRFSFFCAALLAVELEETRMTLFLHESIPAFIIPVLISRRLIQANSDFLRLDGLTSV